MVYLGVRTWHGCTQNGKKEKQVISLGDRWGIR